MTVARAHERRGEVIAHRSGSVDDEDYIVRIRSYGRRAGGEVEREAGG